jgi:GlpG protein
VAVVSNLAQYYASGPVFGGLSGIGYGLFGYLWIKSRFDPAAGMQIPPNLVLFFLIWLVVCALGWFGSVANTAHFVGLLAGIAVAGARLLVRR